MAQHKSVRPQGRQACHGHLRLELLAVDAVHVMSRGK